MTSTSAVREPSLPASADALARRSGEAAGADGLGGDGPGDEFPRLLTLLGEGVGGRPGHGAPPMSESADRGIETGRISTAWRYSPDLGQAAALRPGSNGEAAEPGEAGAEALAGRGRDVQGGIMRTIGNVRASEPQALSQEASRAFAKADALAKPELVDEINGQPESHSTPDYAEAAEQPESVQSREAQGWLSQVAAEPLGPLRSRELSRRDPEPSLVPTLARGRVQQDASLAEPVHADPLSDPEKERANILSLVAPVEVRQAVRTDAPAPRVAELGLQVVRSETHFAPVPQTLPALQIADQVLEAAASLGRPGDTDGPSTPVIANQVPISAPPVKILHIQLQPAELGTVVVRLSLKHDVLNVAVDASESSTAHLLQRDREVLLGLLRSSGYLVDGMSVQVAEPDRLGLTVQHAGNAGSSWSQSTTQSQTGAQTDGGSTDGRGQAQQHAPRQGEREAAETDGGNAGRSMTARGIYV